QGLHCYECLITSDFSSCRLRTCYFPDSFCISQEVVAVMGGQSVLSSLSPAGSETEKLQRKFCLPTCPKDSYQLKSMNILGAVVNSTLSCCKGDLCRAGALATGSLWALTWGLVLSLGSVLLWVLL
ncbi:Lymphocyte antigen 6F, partial [Tupaia chinensis]